MTPDDRAAWREYTHRNIKANTSHDDDPLAHSRRSARTKARFDPTLTPQERKAEYERIDQW